MDPGAAAVVAVHHPGNPLLRLAWSGDVRAYRLSRIGTLVPLTKDHNWAQELLDAGRQPKEWDHSSLMTCLEDGDIGFEEVEMDVVAQLVLCSDGVHHPLENYEPGLMEEALLLALDAKEGAGSLVAEALAQGCSREASSDNATALVVRFPRPGA
ncbi:PP2C family protein-serine/threonine phosphatase [Streptomyces sp. NPDC005151]